MRAALPERVRVTEGPEGRSVHFRWHSSASKWLVLFVVVSPIALGIGWQELLTSHFAQAILGTLAGSFLYVALAGWLNTSTVTLAGRELRVRHGPFPWPGMRRIPAALIRALEVEEHYVQTENGQRLTYHLIAVTRTGKRVRIVSAFDRYDQGAAEFLRRTLTEWLGLGEGASGSGRPAAAPRAG